MTQFKIHEGSACDECGGQDRPVVELARQRQICKSCLRTALTLFDQPPQGVKILTALAPAPVEDSEDSPAYAERICREFLSLNGIEPPAFRFTSGSGGGLHGRYLRESKTVEVFVDTCRQGGVTKARPGFWEDLTVAGVCAHECGHHVDRSTPRLSRGYYDPYMQETPPGLNAKLSRGEDLADALMLLVRNPTLLRDVCPRRHAYLTGLAGLRSAETRGWREILRGDALRRAEEMTGA